MKKSVQNFTLTEVQNIISKTGKIEIICFHVFVRALSALREKSISRLDDPLHSFSKKKQHFQEKKGDLENNLL